MSMSLAEREQRALSVINAKDVKLMPQGGYLLSQQRGYSIRAVMNGECTFELTPLRGGGAIRIGYPLVGGISPLLAPYNQRRNRLMQNIIEECSGGLKESTVLISRNGAIYEVYYTRNGEDEAQFDLAKDNGVVTLCLDNADDKFSSLDYDSETQEMFEKLFADLPDAYAKYVAAQKAAEEAARRKSRVTDR